MKALVIGGTGPTGPGVVRGLTDRGYDVTIYHRGYHETDALPALHQHLHGNADVDSYIYAVYHSASPNNNSKVKDAVLDDLLQGTRREVDPDKRRDLYREVALRIVDQMWSPAIFYPPRWDIWHPYVENFYPHFTNLPSYRFSWLDKS